MSSRAPDAVRRRSRGSALVELMVALPIATLAAICAAVLLARRAAESRASDARLATTRELRHAGRILTEELAPLHAADVVTVSDTLLEVRLHLGVLTACWSDSTGVVLGSVWPEDEITWVSALRGGDGVRTWRDAADLAGAPVPQDGVLTAVPAPLGRGPCGRHPDVPRWRVVAAGVGPSMAGAPALFRRAVRYQHYRSGSDWWLGRRAYTGTAWETMQPVAGPLRSPAHGGVQMRALDRVGAGTGIRDSIVLLRIALRAADDPVRRGALDSARVDVRLQAAAWLGGPPGGWP